MRASGLGTHALLFAVTLLTCVALATTSVALAQDGAASGALLTTSDFEGPYPLLTLSAVVPIHLIGPSSGALGGDVLRPGGGVEVLFALPVAQRLTMDFGGGFVVHAFDGWSADDPRNTLDTARVTVGARYWLGEIDGPTWFCGGALSLDLRWADPKEVEAGATLDASFGLVSGGDDVVAFNFAVHLGVSSPSESLGAALYVGPSLGLSFFSQD
jgi:hypothetical protein